MSQNAQRRQLSRLRNAAVRWGCLSASQAWGYDQPRACSFPRPTKTRPSIVASARAAVSRSERSQSIAAPTTHREIRYARRGQRAISTSRWRYTDPGTARSVDRQHQVLVYCVPATLHRAWLGLPLRRMLLVPARWYFVWKIGWGFIARRRSLGRVSIRGGGGSGRRRLRTDLSGHATRMSFLFTNSPMPRSESSRP